MIEKIDEKLKIEIEKMLLKENLIPEEIQLLLNYKNDLKFDEKIKKMIEFSM